MEFFVETRHADHALGTKFYRTFVITPGDRKRSVFVSYWGSLQTSKKIIPKEWGFIKVEGFAGKGAVRAEEAKREDKSKRDYQSWTLSTKEIDSTAEMNTWLTQMFKPEDVRLIVKLLGDSYGAASGGAQVVDDGSEKPPVITMPVVVTATTNADWGGW